MQRGTGVTVWVMVAAVCGGCVVAGYRLRRLATVKSITGAVLRQDDDPGKRPPIGGVEVSVIEGASTSPVRSNASGLFQLDLHEGVRRGDSVTLRFRHHDYQPLEIIEAIDDRLYVVAMTPVPRAPEMPRSVTLADLRVRYTIKSRNTSNGGTAVKLFEIRNQGNVPCSRHDLCSPDGRWKANVGEASLDAGEGNVFVYARVACIAGPCPFTRIDKDSFSQGGRLIGVRIRDWSDTARFSLEAEIMHSSVGEFVLRTFPVVLSDSMSFTLPATAEGPSIEVTVDGEEIVYPLGPGLRLPWAECSAQAAADRSSVYRCALKPGYRFK